MLPSTRRKRREQSARTRDGGGPFPPGFFLRRPQWRGHHGSTRGFSHQNRGSNGSSVKRHPQCFLMACFLSPVCPFPLCQDLSSTIGFFPNPLTYLLYSALFDGMETKYSKCPFYVLMPPPPPPSKPVVRAPFFSVRTNLPPSIHRHCFPPPCAHKTEHDGSYPPLFWSSFFCVPRCDCAHVFVMFVRVPPRWISVPVKTSFATFPSAITPTFELVSTHHVLLSLFP